MLTRSFQGRGVGGGSIVESKLGAERHIRVDLGGCCKIPFSALAHLSFALTNHLIL